jgi:hypothetical protein
MARLFDPRRADLVPLPDPATDLPLVAELDPVSSRNLAVTQLADLLALYGPRLTAAQVREAASPGKGQTFDPETFKAAVSALHQEILTEFAADQRVLSGYQLGLALSDTCWMPSAASPDAFLAAFRRDRVALLTMWLNGAGNALPESSAALAGRSLQYWQDWIDANSDWLRAGDDRWAERAGPVLSALREQGRAWHSVLSTAAPSTGGYDGQPGTGAWLMALSSGLRSARLLAYRILRLYWTAGVLLAVVSGGLLYLMVADLSGSAGVWAPAVVGVGVLGLAVAALIAGLSRASDGIWPGAWSMAQLDVRARQITSLPDLPRQGNPLARRVTAGVLACAASAGVGGGLVAAGATIADAIAIGAGVLAATGIVGAVFLLAADRWPRLGLRLRRAKRAQPPPGAAEDADPWGTAVDESPAPRVVNLTVADEAGAVLPAAATLASDASYLLQVGLGPKTDETIVRNPVALPLADLTQSAGGGWWFDVVAASADVDVAADAHRMFVPFQGAGWACPCTGEEHTCLPSERRAYLEIAFRTRAGAGPRALRCTVYHNNNAVQSIRVAFTTGDAGRASATLIHGTVDYSLADDLALAGELAPRRLSVVTNQSFGTSGLSGAASGGTHTIVVKGADTPPVAVNLTEAGVTETLRAMRTELTLITLGKDGLGTRYDKDNAAPAKQLTTDLETLAYLGSRFWQDAVPFGADQDALKPLLETSATIQIARVTDTVFPWALVYDYPHLLDDPWVPCELLRQWPAARAALGGYPAACPFAAGHELNTLCPYGFWGFRHLIEQPPSVARGRLRTEIPVPAGAHAAAVRSLNLDSALSAAHLKRLGEYLAPRFTITDCDSRADFVAAIDGPALPLIYFYCHGKTAVLGHKGVDLLTPYLEIGLSEKLGTGDLNAWAAAGQWHRERWRVVPPLVFINGCHTAALSPEQLVTFVNAFAGAEAAGVVGTEIAVAQPVASEFAQLFYMHLMAGVSRAGLTVGQALRRARFDLLAKGNVTGLVYTAFCSMDLVLGTGENAA